jgi:hypothetical protein
MKTTRKLYLLRDSFSLCFTEINSVQMNLLKLKLFCLFTAIVSINCLLSQNIADSLYLPELVITEKTGDKKIHHCMLSHQR